MGAEATGCCLPGAIATSKTISCNHWRLHYLTEGLDVWYLVWPIKISLEQPACIKCHIKCLSYKVCDTSHLMEHHCTWRGNCPVKRLIIFSSDTAKTSWWWCRARRATDPPLFLTYRILYSQLPSHFVKVACNYKRQPRPLLKCHQRRQNPTLWKPEHKDRAPWRRRMNNVSRCGWLLKPSNGLWSLGWLKQVWRATTTLAPRSGYSETPFCPVVCPLPQTHNKTEMFLETYPTKLNPKYLSWRLARTTETTLLPYLFLEVAPNK